MSDEAVDDISVAPAESRAWWRPSWESRWTWVLVVSIVSLVAHLWRLGLRPLAHDETIDAWFSWNAREFGVMEYDPIYHGPLRFYLVGPVLRWVGTGAAEVRLVAALAGVATTAIIAASTRTLGRAGAPLAALVFVVSPTVLTVTRTGREDSLVALVSVCMLLLVARALVAPRPAHLLGLGALLACSFALKETTFLFGLAALCFFVAGGALAAARPSQCRDAVRRLGALGREVWLAAVTVFALTFMFIFTSGFRYAAGLESGMLDGIEYWWSQHDVGRGGQPWFFYLAVYAAYEWLLLGLAVVGVAVTVRRRSLVGAWFTWMMVSQVALYAWAGEKFAWLSVHPLLPAVLLSGIGAEALVARVRRARPSVAMFAGAGFAALVAATAVVAVRPAITDGADPRELLVTVQTSVDVPPIAQRLREMHEAGEIESIVVDTTSGGSWPWVWYLHGLDGVSYRLIRPEEPLPEADALIVFATEFPPAAAESATVERFRLREWWVPDYENMSMGDALHWFFTRSTWSPTGSSDQYLVLR